MAVDPGRPAFPPALTAYVIATGLVATAFATAGVRYVVGVPEDALLLAVIGLAIAVCNVVPFHVDARPDSEGVSAEDVFVIAGLALLPLPGLLAATAIAAVLSPAARYLTASRVKLRTMAPLKLVFNSALIVIYGASAGLFVQAVGVEDDVVVRAAVAVVGALLGNVLTRAAVAVAISLASGRSAPELFVEDGAAAALGVAAASALGLLLALVLSAYDGDAVLVLAMTVAVVAGSRLLNRQLGDQTTVTDLLRAAEEIHAAVGGGDVERATIVATRRLMRTNHVELTDRAVATDTGMCVAVPSLEGDPLWLLVERDLGSDRRVHEDERPILEALAAIVANARDNALLMRRIGHSDRTRGALLASLSHDLRSPLAASLTTSRTLLTHDLDDATTRRLLEGQERSLARMERILGDLIELERAELLPDHQATSRLSTVVARAIDDLALPERPEVRVDVADLCAEMEPRALERVVENLVTNAAKHTTSGTIWARAWREGRAVVLAIEDDGPGVPAAVREAILRPFEQAGGPERGGLGLGLFVASRLLSLYGGRLSVTDRDGGGASFQVCLRACDAEPAISRGT